MKLLKAAEGPGWLGNLQPIGCTNSAKKHLPCQSLNSAGSTSLFRAERTLESGFFLPQIVDAVTFFLVICTDKVVIPSVFRDAKIAFGDIQIIK